MLTDEIIKWRINKLNGVISKLNGVDDKLNDFNNQLIKLNKVLGENVLIDDSIAYEEYLDDINSKPSEIANEVKGKIIPGLKNTIYKLRSQMKGQ